MGTAVAALGAIVPRVEANSQAALGLFASAATGVGMAVVNGYFPGNPLQGQEANLQYIAFFFAFLRWGNRVPS